MSIAFVDLRSIPAKYQTPAAALFALLLGAAWLTAWGWKLRATDGIVERELQRSIAVATSLSNALLPRYQAELRHAAATSPKSVSRLEFLGALSEDVATQVRGQHVLKVEIHDSRGVVIHSTNQGEIGHDQSGDPEVRRALHGEALASLTKGSQSGIPGYQPDDDRQVVRAFVPASLGAFGRQDAVFEVYSDVSSALADISQEAHTVWAIANLAGFVVFGVALIILRRAEAAQRRKDTVTGLPGRANAIASMVAVQKTLDGKLSPRFGWLVVAVQRLRQVGAAYGHQAAEEVMRQAAARLRTLPGSEQRLFSLGGDTFALVVADHDSAMADEELAARLARGVLERFAAPIECEEHAVLAELAIGVALGSGGDANPEDLMNHAEVAMAEAKRRGNSHWLLYIPGLEHGVRDRLQSMGGLREALERQQFMVYYQPIVDARTRAWVGCEALLRWRHPVRGLVLPEFFIPLLEETGMIVTVGMFVMREACRQTVEWRRTLSPGFTVSVNLSARQFADPDLLAHVRQVLDETGLPADALTIEVTETCLALEPDYAATVLAQLRRLGVAVAIDDFGVGYSSLSSLRRLPVDILKIDRSFVTQAPYDPVDASIAQAIAALARGLDLTLVAEGVETEAHAEFTRNLGCDKLQGFLFERPLGALDFEAACRPA